MVPAVTLVELVEAVLECAGSEAEAVATIAYMVNARKVRLAGTFRDVRFDLRAMVPHQARTATEERPARRARRASLWSPA
jgi:hypothetical protein